MQQAEGAPHDRPVASGSAGRSRQQARPLTRTMALITVVSLGVAVITVSGAGSEEAEPTDMAAPTATPDPTEPESDAAAEPDPTPPPPPPTPPRPPTLYDPTPLNERVLIPERTVRVRGTLEYEPLDRAQTWFDRLGVPPTTPFARIPAADRDPRHDPALGTLRVRDELQVLEDACGAEVRRVVGIDLGADGSPRIDAALAALTAQALAEQSAAIPDAPASCDPDRARAWVYQQVAEVPCAVPDGRPHRCLEIDTHSSDSGRFGTVQRPVIDVRAGKVVSLEELVATVGGSAYSVRESLGDQLCAAEAAERSDGDGPKVARNPCRGLPTGVWPVPSADALAVVIDPLPRYITRSTLTVPWSVVAEHGMKLHEPPDPSDVTEGEPRPVATEVTTAYGGPGWMSRLGVSRLIPMERIPAELADPAVPPGLGPLRVTGEIQRARRYCAAELRHIVGVDVGPGPAAARIGEALVDVARDFLAEAQWITTFGEDWCLNFGDRRPWSYQQLQEEPCLLPGGPPVRCFTLDQWAYHEGDGRAMFELHQATYDVTTGEEVPVERILAAAGGDPATALARTRAVLCGPTVAEVFPVSRFGECTDIPITRAHPTEHGVWLGFTRDDLYLDFLMEEVFVPWRLIAAAEVG